METDKLSDQWKCWNWRDEVQLEGFTPDDKSRIANKFEIFSSNIGIKF